MQRHQTVETFRSRLLEVIRASGQSRSAFAKKVGIDRSTLSQILSDHNQRLPRVETLAAIAESENVSIDWLVGLSEEGALRAEVIDQTLQFAPGGRSPSDERLASWHREAAGYKIRYVPSTLPDLLKSDEVIDWEYSDSPTVTAAQRRSLSQERLAYQRRPETDMEVCSSLQSLWGFAKGEHLWNGLHKEARLRQVQQMRALCSELYPTFRWFLFDARIRYSTPLTIFGPIRAVLYIGHRYIVFNGRDHVRILTTHFDELIRSAVVQPPSVIELLEEIEQALATGKLDSDTRP